MPIAWVALGETDWVRVLLPPSPASPYLMVPRGDGGDPIWDLKLLSYSSPPLIPDTITSSTCS